MADWKNTNLGVDELPHYIKIYREAFDRNPNIPDAADKTFRSTVKRLVGKGEEDAIEKLLEEVKKGFQASS